ncbi:DUF262 domain-containing protein [Stackebrandtia soli]
MAVSDTQPSAETHSLEDLVEKAWEGKIRVPHFQRDFRWSSKDVVRLFDSISRGYPIGTLLFWVRRSPVSEVSLGNLTVSAEASDAAWWVVDGQQRIVSLANALDPSGHKTKPFDVYYDLAEEQFVPAPRKLEPKHIPLPVLFDLEKLIEWFSPGNQGPPEYFKPARAIAKRILEYRIPTYLVAQEDRKILTDIFDRMNNFGKRLSRAEVFSALYAGDEPPTRTSSRLTQISQRLAESTHFGRIDDDTVLSCLLARRGPDITRDPHGEFDATRSRVNGEFADEDEQTAHDETERAMAAAVRFVQAHCETPHFSFLPYRALLAVLTRFFAHFPDPHPRHRDLLRRFFWRASFTGPAAFSGSFTLFARKLAGMVVPGSELQSVSQLLEAVGQQRTKTVSVEAFKTNSASTKILLCSWWSLRPRSPFTGDLYTVNDLASALGDDVTPRSAVEELIQPSSLPSDLRGSAAIRILLPSVEDPVNEAALALIRPYGGLSIREWDEVLVSHCMTREAATYLQWDNTAEFVDNRQRTIDANLNVFGDRMAEWKREDAPPLSSFLFHDMD